MWLIKSIGLGLLAVLAALVVCVISAVIAVFILSARDGSGGGIGWAPVSLIRQQPWLAVAMVVLLCLLFALGVGAGHRRYFAR
jgi:hypothetical protein